MGTELGGGEAGGGKYVAGMVAGCVRDEAAHAEAGAGHGQWHAGHCKLKGGQRDVDGVCGHVCASSLPIYPCCRAVLLVDVVCALLAGGSILVYLAWEDWCYSRAH